MAKINGFIGDYSGLTTPEVKLLQLHHGKNELVPEKRNLFIARIISFFKEPMFLLLFFTAGLYFVLGETRDGVTMLFSFLFIAIIYLFQEWRTDKTLQALKDLSSQRVKVIRNDSVEDIDSRELTVGDLMIVGEGDKIAADGQLIEMYDLGVDESTLTGESEVVWKKINHDNHDEFVYWKKDFCYAGTSVTQGSAIIEVAAVGQNTEYGRIGLDFMSIPQKPTPLEKQVNHLIKLWTLVGLALFMMVFLATLINSNNLVDSILSGITMVMALIPEEFPVVLTVFLSMGAWRLARKSSLIRRLPSLETLGSVSVLCVDKTGTLTKNQMLVQDISTFKSTAENHLIYWAALACEAEPYDPMEKAILIYAESKQIDKNEIFDKVLLHEYPFSSDTKMMGHVWDIEGIPSLAAKGAPERILPLCRLSNEELKQVEYEQEKLALKGYRVVAVAGRKNITTIPEEISDNQLELLGLIGLEDPPRDAVPEAISVCAKAGIRIIMITGDNGITAQSIARKIGIKDTANVITGQQLETMSDDELKEKVKNTNIFARVIPRHKMRIVKALKDNGDTVAMTGDGVNDAPALKIADIGIAMGKRGTEVAKEASDMILLDDNFTTIIETVKDGRRIFDNIKKAIQYIFVIHIPIGLTALFTPLLHMPLLLQPIHIVLLEFIIDPTCSIIFERQPAEPDLMDRKPRPPMAALVNKDLLIKAILQGLAIFLAVFGSYIYLTSSGWSVNEARTFTLVIFAFANLFLVYINQSDRQLFISSLFKFRDKVVWYINGGLLTALALVIYLPVGNAIAKTTPLSISELASAIGMAALATFWWEATKLFKRSAKSA